MTDQYVGAGKVDVLFVGHTCPTNVARQVAETIANMASKRGMQLLMPFYYKYSDSAEPRANLEHVRLFYHFMLLFLDVREYPPKSRKWRVFAKLDRAVY